MATTTISYGTAQTMTVTNLGALASDATNLVAGWASAAVDNTAVLGATGSASAVDVHVGGKVQTGTSPTASKQVEVWAYGSYDGTTFSAGASGSEGAFSPTGEKTSMRLLTVLPTDATTNHTYEWGPFSIAAAFGGAVPRKWGIYIVHNTAVALSAAANQEVKFSTIAYVTA